MSKHLRPETKVTATKMAEQSQVQQETMKNPKKVQAGKKFAQWNHRKRKSMHSSQKLGVSPS